jgi:hypothetical protein
MVCRVHRSHDGDIIICIPDPVQRKISTQYCQDCKQQSWFLSWWYEFYGPTEVCLRCGRRWEDGEWMPLALERGSRDKSIAQAKQVWRENTASERRNSDGEE